jgi:hypothetical protein
MGELIGSIIGLTLLAVALLFLLLCYCTAHSNEVARQAPTFGPKSGVGRARTVPNVSTRRAVTGICTP